MAVHLHAQAWALEKLPVHCLIFPWNVPRQDLRKLSLHEELLQRALSPKAEWVPTNSNLMPAAMVEPQSLVSYVPWT